MGDYGRAVEAIFQFATISFFVLLPLAIWKLIDIAIWLWNNVNISWGAA